jgi:hypothetical protein
VSFAIANNLLTPSNKVVNLKITPRVTKATWNNFKNPKDGSSGMKHLERCSYTIPKSPLEDKWGVMAEA